MENKENYVYLKVADGTEMACYTAYPTDSAESAPGLILIQEAFGVNHHIRNVTDKFAKDGYVVISPELYHRTAPAGLEGSYTDFPSMMPHMQALTLAGQEADLMAVYQWLIENDKVDKNKIYSIGYCLGGRVSFLANAILPLSAGISYYGGGISQMLAKASDLHGPHLFFWGGKDQHIKQDDINAVIKAVDDAGKDYINVKISYADHGFNCDEREAYNEKASKEALALALAFLKNN